MLFYRYKFKYISKSFTTTIVNTDYFQQMYFCKLPRYFTDVLSYLCEFTN